MTAADEAADAVRLWVNDRRAEGSGGYAVRGDTVVVRWVGQPPRALRRYVETLGVTVLFERATFSEEQLLRAAEQVISTFPEVISSAGAAEDGSGIKVTLLPAAASDDATRERCTGRLRTFLASTSQAVPLEVTGVLDALELAHRSTDSPSSEGAGRSGSPASA